MTKRIVHLRCLTKMKENLENNMTTLDKEEIVRRLKDDVGQDELLAKADKVRHDYVGDEVHLRGLVEF